MKQIEMVWAEEPGIMVKFERNGSQVIVSVLDVDNRGERVLASGTLGGWRWDRVAQNMAFKAVESVSACKHVTNILTTGLCDDCGKKVMCEKCGCRLYDDGGPHFCGSSQSSTATEGEK